jgi:hypothetical protein
LEEAGAEKPEAQHEGAANANRDKVDVLQWGMLKRLSVPVPSPKGHGA